MIKLKKPVHLFVPILSVAMVLLLVPEQADARRNSRSSVNHNKNTNRNVNRNRNTNVNVNRNTNVNVNVNVNNRGRYYHPVATGLAVGAAVVVTAAVIGSVVHTVPAGCVTVIRGGIAYQQCGSTWYQPQYAGNNVSYIVIQQP